MTAWSRKTWKFCEQFLHFFVKKQRSVANRHYAKFARASLPGSHIWLTLFQISSKSVHFRWSYCRTREDRFCPVEYFQYRLFEPVKIEACSRPCRFWGVWGRCSWFYLLLKFTCVLFCEFLELRLSPVCCSVRCAFSNYYVVFLLPGRVKSGVGVVLCVENSGN